MKHGMCHTRFYSVWQNMKRRCGDSTHDKYSYYGGRGIKCVWKDFKSFMEDMYGSYQMHTEKHGEQNTFIERIQNNGDYCKENCKWSTRAEQCRNRRSNVIVTFNGQTKCFGDWVNELGLNRLTIRARLKRGWSIEDAFTKKVVHKPNSNT